MQNDRRVIERASEGRRAKMRSNERFFQTYVHGSSWAAGLRRGAQVFGLGAGVAVLAAAINQMLWQWQLQTVHVFVALAGIALVAIGWGAGVAHEQLLINIERWEEMTAAPAAAPAAAAVPPVVETVPDVGADSQRPIVAERTSGGVAYKIGRHEFTQAQLRGLATAVAVRGNNFSHRVLQGTAIITDRTDSAQAQLASEIQAELVRLGYAEKRGDRKPQYVATESGKAWLLRHLPHSNSSAVVGETLDHHHQPPTTTTSNGVGL